MILRDINKIYIPHDDGLGYEECYLLEVSCQYKNYILEEVIFSQDILAELKKNQLRGKNQINIDLENEIEKIIRESKIEISEDIDMNQSKNQKIKGIRYNRMIEKEINREKENLIIGTKKNDNKNVGQVIELPHINNEEKIEESEGKNKIMEMLRKKRDEKRER